MRKIFSVYFVCGCFLPHLLYEAIALWLFSFIAVKTVCVKLTYKTVLRINIFCKFASRKYLVWVTNKFENEKNIICSLFLLCGNVFVCAGAGDISLESCKAPRNKKVWLCF